MTQRWGIRVGHVLDELAKIKAESIQCVVTSPPYYGLRDYKTEPQIWGGDAECPHGQNAGRGQFCTTCDAWRGSLGLEPTPGLFIDHLVAVFRAVWRVLRKDGVLFLNLGDSYYSNPSNGRGGGSTLSGGKPHLSGVGRVIACDTSGTSLKPKDLIGMPWRVAFALQADGWWLRQDNIWAKPNPMPESVRDRPTRAHEYMFLLSKSSRYYYDADAVRTPAKDAADDQRRIAQQHPTQRQGLRPRVPSGWDTSNGSHRELTGRYPSGEGSFTRLDREGKNSRMHQDRDPSHPAERKQRQPSDEQATGANLRSVWWIATQPYKEAHFATFPEALVEPCLLAGTSEHGACAACGAPYRRLVQAGLTEHDGDTATPYDATSTAGRLAQLRQAARARGGEYVNGAVTTGWDRSCSCGCMEAPVPCTVLDPFSGSGTVGVVALRLGCSFTGIELNHAYRELARQRIVAEAPLLYTGAEDQP